ncbi:MAG: co-chaperone GroES [Candidatus Woesearchaeota archaeon]|nr:MAG: co-chaperone GroES [Candidatus Woesearchaeota archaeon]
MAKILPLQDKVLLKKGEQKKSREEIVGGIILPTEEEKLEYGEVVAVSKELKECSLKIGDKVIYSEYSGRTLSLEGTEYNLISYKDISAVLEL